MPDKPHGPSGWWTVTCNGIPVRHFGPDKKDLAQRYATDPAYRASLATKKLWEAGRDKSEQ
jgi:cytochrome c551/c552